MKETTILFMCPHNAAKSILAAAYGEQLARERQLGWTILTAGTEPDDALAPAVVTFLKQEGLAVSDKPPHRVTPAEVAAADWIVSMECDLTQLVPVGKNVVSWDDIPPPSQSVPIAAAAIRDRLKKLAAQVK